MPRLMLGFSLVLTIALLASCEGPKVDAAESEAITTDDDWREFTEPELADLRQRARTGDIESSRILYDYLLASKGGRLTPEAEAELQIAISHDSPDAMMMYATLPAVEGLPVGDKAKCKRARQLYGDAAETGGRHGRRASWVASMRERRDGEDLAACIAGG